jgi:hypothetical protein
MFTFKKLALIGLASLTAFAMSCSDDPDPDPDPVINPSTPLVKKTMTLSYADSSYGDVDAAKGYKKSGITTKAIAGDIDLIAFAGTTVGAASYSKIYTPSMDIEVDAANSDDIFWTLFLEACPAFDLNDMDFTVCNGNMGPYGIVIIPLTGAAAAAVSIIDNAETKGDLDSWLDGLDAFLDNAEYETDFDLANNKGFLLITSKKEMVAVILKKVTTSPYSAASVELNITYMPK